MRYVVLDIEADGQTTYKRFCNPLDYDNEKHGIVMIQYKPYNKDAYVYHTGFPEKITNDSSRHCKLDLEDVDLIIGQNIKFDLLFLWENENLQKFFDRGGQIWDTLIAEYLLEGQRNQSYSLNTLAAKYGGTQKDEVVFTDYYSQGKVSSDIPKDVLEKYGLNDVLNTELVYKKQLKRIKSKQQLNLIRLWMRHLLLVTMMEYNGIYIDLDRLESEQTKVQKQINHLHKKLVTFAAQYYPSGVEFNPSSPKQVGALLYGGTIKYKQLIDNPSKTGELFILSGPNKGKKRQKWSQVETTIKGLNFIDDASTPSTASSTIKQLYKEHKHPILKDLINYKKLMKLDGTYYSGLYDVVHQHSGCIHSEFKIGPYYHNNSAYGISPVTGRLSSSHPNVQNLHPTFLECIKSRKENRSILEVDYSQLEIFLLASISKCSLLSKHLRDGIDIHLNNAVRLFDKSADEVTPKERKLAKVLSFELTYGAGPGRMMKSHNIEFQVARKFITQFYAQYPEIKQWHQTTAQQVEAEKRYRQDGSAYSYLRSPLGKRYYVEDVEAPDFKKEQGIERCFYEPQLKDYPIQGAAAVVVSTAGGMLFKYCRSFDDSLLIINEIHDAFVFECEPAHIELHKKNIKEIMTTKTMQVIEKYLGFEFLAPLKVDFSIGKTYGDCKK